MKYLRRFAVVVVSRTTKIAKYSSIVPFKVITYQAIGNQKGGGGVMPGWCVYAVLCEFFVAFSLPYIRASEAHTNTPSCCVGELIIGNVRRLISPILRHTAFFPIVFVSLSAI